MGLETVTAETLTTLPSHQRTSPAMAPGAVKCCPCAVKCHLAPSSAVWCHVVLSRRRQVLSRRRIMPARCRNGVVSVLPGCRLGAVMERH